MTKVEQETEREQEKVWALKMADLEEGYVVSAGYKTITDIVQILKLQEDTRKEVKQGKEAVQQSSPKKPRARAAKPATG
jgi:hypothetical protein